MTTRVHATLDTPTGPRQVTREDVAGRWFIEHGGRRTRIKSIADAVAEAFAMERDGGQIHTGVTGGKQFDSKVAGARRGGWRR